MNLAGIADVFVASFRRVLPLMRLKVLISVDLNRHLMMILVPITLFHSQGSHEFYMSSSCSLRAHVLASPNYIA